MPKAGPPRRRSSRPIAGNAGAVLVPVRVKPQARRGGIEGVTVDADGTRRLAVAVTAAPEGGKANQAVIALLAKAWKLPKFAISVAAGTQARNKTLRVAGAPPSILASLARAGGEDG